MLQALFTSFKDRMPSSESLQTFRVDILKKFCTIWVLLVKKSGKGGRSLKQDYINAIMVYIGRICTTVELLAPVLVQN